MSLDDDTDRPEPVAGTEFPTSTGKALSGALGGLVMTGLGLLVVLWRFEFFILFNRRPGIFITIAAGLVALLGPFLVIHSLMQLLRKRRLVLGADRLQVIDARGGTDVVVTQVMYANVENLLLINDEGVKQVNVKLADKKAEGTFDDAGAIRQRPDQSGFDLVVENIYRGKLEDLVREIDEAVLAWRAKQPGA